VLNLTEWDNLLRCYLSVLVVLEVQSDFFSGAFLTEVGNKWSDVGRCKEGKLERSLIQLWRALYEDSVVCVCCVDV